MHINLQEIQTSQERNQLPPDIVGGSILKDLIKTIAEALVDQPEQLSVAEGSHLSSKIEGSQNRHWKSNRKGWAQCKCD